MRLLALKILFLLASLVTATVVAARAQGSEGIAQALNERVLFVTSGGYWEEVVEPQSDTGDTAEASAEEADPNMEAAPAETRRGYYRLIARRGADNRSLVDLQQIALTPEGPQLALSISVEEINALGAYITDIRPEDSTGTASQYGFSAFIYLKTDPTVAEPDTWALFVDEFGEIVVEKSSN